MTGFPKGVPTNHSAVVSGITEAMEIVEGKVGEGGDDIFIIVNPLFHELAQLIILSWGLGRGNPVALMPIPELDVIQYVVEKHKVTFSVPGERSKYTIQHRIDVGDLPGHKIRIAELRRSFTVQNPLKFQGVRVLEEYDRFFVSVFQGIGITSNLSYSKFTPPEETATTTTAPAETTDPPSRPKYWIWWIVIGIFIVLGIVFLSQSKNETYLEEEDQWEINEDWQEIDNKDDDWQLEETENEDFEDEE